MFSRPPRPKFPRRGVTLIEMLVTVALLVLMMVIIVQIFGAATGAVSAARTYQDLDSGLRQLDATIRQDLGNLTLKKMIPPRDPKNNEGYFEYIENSFADIQGEDTDDCLRFTVKAPEGQAFAGRFYPGGSINLSQNPTLMSSMTSIQYEIYKNSRPITIESQYAEVIYFLRNGNLYRRVLLVAPERQPVVNQINGSNPSNGSNFVGGVFSPAAPNLQTLVSWQGLNDLSAHPAKSFTSSTIILNTLADLTNRENRYAAPRFTNDFAQFVPNTGWTPGPDGFADDTNSDTVNDFVPSLYFSLPTTAPWLLNLQPANPTFTGATFSTVAFPYVYPYAYSKPDLSNAQGWIHAPDPLLPVNSVTALALINHSPLEFGDSLPGPSASGVQTWWGFPTWRETMSPSWMDPWVYVGSPQVPPATAGTGGFATASQAPGLNPFDASSTATASNSTEQLPPMTLGLVGSQSGMSTAGVTSRYRTAAQLGNDPSKGADTFAAISMTGKPVDFLWRQCWEDDLIMTGVRSFDVKAYDNSYPGYVDLGWGDDGRLLIPYNGAGMASTPTPSAWTPPLMGNNGIIFSKRDQAYGGPNFSGPLFVWPPVPVLSGGLPYFPNQLYGMTLAHEGRIPPLIWDNRPDAQAPALSPNIGDNSGSIVRLRRTWDSWSTDYTNAPSSGVQPNGQPYGLSIGQQPIYPSYPPPYPLPLRGIQIQIRAVDPRNERVKVLTIKQDFSDRL